MINPISRIVRNPVVLFLWLAFLGLTLLMSCSTKKNTFTRRVYHNLTGHFNTYWNGNESYREGVKQLNSSVQDNYNKILLVFNYGTETEAQSLNSQMDRAIEKASINIQRHSMYFNRREYVKWIDDSYLMIGKAYFYKQEYNKARRTFEFVMNEYKYNPIKYEATLWLANSLIRLEKYQRAQSVLDNLQNDINKGTKIPRRVVEYLPLMRADLYLCQEKYSQAKGHLETALYYRYKKNLDARIRFILGQIYQSEGELYTASEYYLQVIKKNPTYVMAFNAGINLAQCYDTRYGESTQIEKKLKKMLKEDKNMDFRDQIYYALADIAFKNSNDTLAIYNLRLSVASSLNNNFQKSKSALMLGDLFFQKQEYELSQAYYDTAMQVLPEDYPNYEKISAKTSYLTELVSNLVVIKTEDSLQYVASLSEDERNAIIDKIIEEKKLEEERKKEEEELMAMSTTMPGMNRGGLSGGPPMGSPTGTGSWYFYNPAALSQGFTEFTKKWGRRKLEDNWRLSNKQAAFDLGETLAEGDSLVGDSSVVLSTDPFKRETYMQYLPLSEEKLAESNKKIEDALFNLGFIYKDKLNNMVRSVESFEKLISRFPGNEHLLESYYYLYRLHTELGNFEKAEEYKNLIVENFPDSDYAKLLTDPDYFKELEAQKNLVLNLYSETWDAYTTGQYYTVIANSNRALETYTEPKAILPKFEYLRALSIGRVDVTDSLLTSLEALLQKYPDSDVAPLAQNIVDYMKGPPADSVSDQPDQPEVNYDLSIYKYRSNSGHFFTLVVDDGRVNVEALKVKVSDFNSKFYSIENLSITNVTLTGNLQLIMSGNFDGANKAMLYYKTILKNEYVFSNLKEDEYDAFVLSQDNYPAFYKDKDIEKYMTFFRKNYLEGKE